MENNRANIDMFFCLPPVIKYTKNVILNLLWCNIFYTIEIILNLTY